MVKRFSAVALVLLLVLGSQAQAQRPGGGGRGGPRGFGGGMMPVSGGMLLRSPEVQNELKLTDKQKEDVTKLAESQEGNRPDFQGLRDLSPDEREKKMAELRKQFEEHDKQMISKLGSILDEKQLERLSQLRMQREGVSALGREAVANKLGLTADQQEKIRTIQAEARPQGGRNFQDLSDDERREQFTKMQEQREKAEASITAVLNDEQKANWEKMQGAKFDFPRGGGPGGGPGGRGAGGERRRPATKE